MIAAHPLATVAICRDCGCGAFPWPGRSEVACVHGHGLDLPPLPVRTERDDYRAGRTMLGAAAGSVREVWT